MAAAFERSLKKRNLLFLLIAFVEVFAVFENLVDKAEFDGFFRGHVIVAVGGRFDFLSGFAAVVAKNVVETTLQAIHELNGSFDVSGSALCPAGDLVDHDVGVGQAEALSLGSCSKQNGSHGGADADAVGVHITGEELHGVVDSQSGGDGAPGGVDVDVDVLFWVLHLEEKHLGDDGVGHAVVDTGADENNAVLEEARVDVKGTFATTIGLDDGGNEVIVLWRDVVAGVHCGNHCLVLFSFFRFWFNLRDARVLQ